ncbi:MAG: hypothetical protein ACFFAI_15220, partial [Promethearchaeota archaeon]
MRFKYIYPLLAFLVCMILITIFFIRDFMWIIIPSFIIFYPMPYLSALKETVKNRNVVIKIKNKSPFMIPILFFSLPTVIINTIFLITDVISLSLFFMVYFFSLIFYFSGIYILIRDLKKEFEISIRPI